MGRGDDRIGFPSVRLGDRDRQLRELERDRHGDSPERAANAGERDSRSPGTGARSGGRARAPARGLGGRRPGAATTARRCRGSSERQRAGRCWATSLGGSSVTPPPENASPRRRRRDHRAGGRAPASPRPAAGPSAAGDHRGRSRRAARRRRCRRRSRRAGRRGAALGERDRQLRVRLERVGREGGQQRANRRRPAVEDEPEAVVGEQARGVRPVPGGLRVADRLDDVPVASSHCGGRPVQRFDHVGWSRRSSSRSRSANRWW